MELRKKLRAALSGVLALQLAMPVWLIPTPVAAAGETITFVGSPKYVRANNGGDLDAQVIATNTTDSVDFYIDGSLTPVSTSTVIPGAAAGYEWYRLYTPLAPGEHTLVAVANISGGGTATTSTPGTVYSLDLPTVSYVIPSATTAVFRSSDNPLRINAEDQFNQFKQAIFTISNSGGVVGTYTVTRAQCDLREAGNRVLCDVNDSATWSPLPDGNYTAKVTTYTMANNRADNIPSLPFIVDNTKPTLSNFTIDSPTGVSTYQASITVSANASHVIGVADVDFWVTNPESRPAGPVCTGNGTRFATATVASTDGDGKYRTTLNTSALDGLYCLNAQSESLSHGHSTPIATAMVLIDNTEPATTLSTPLDDAITNSSITIAGSSIDNQQVAAVHLYYRAAGGGAWAPITTVTNPVPGTPYVWSYDWTPATDGSYDIKASAEDVAGNVESSAYAYNIAYDTTAPVVTEVTPVSTPTNDADPDYTFSSTEAGTIGYAGGCNSATTVATAGDNTIELLSLSDGTYVGCTVTVTDAAGNTSSALTLTSFTIDTTAPAVAITSTTPAANGITRGDFTINGTATDTLSGITSVTLLWSPHGAGTWTTLATPTVTGGVWTYTFRPSSADYYDFMVTGVDAAGNAATPDEVDNLGFDRTTPTGSFISPASGSWFNGSFNLTGTALDNLAGVDRIRLRIDTQPWVTLDLPTQYNTPTTGYWQGTIDPTALANGQYRVQLSIRDAANNSRTINLNTIGYDSETPVTTITDPADNSYHNSAITIDGSSSDGYSGVASVAISYRASGAVSWTSLNTDTNPTPVAGTYDWTPYSWNTVPSDGVWEIMVETTDVAGNTSSVIRTVTYDTKAPTLTVVTPITTPSNNTTPSFTFNTDEAGSITYDGLCSSPTTVATAGDNTITFNALPEGIYTDCTVMVTDAAGNPSTSLAVGTFVIDTTAPVTTLSSPSNNVFVNSSLTISGTSTDAVGLSQVRLYSSPAGADTWTLITTVALSGTSAGWSYNWTPSSEGSYDIKAAATDAAGNEEHSAYARNITFDVTAPTIVETQIIKDGVIINSLTVGDIITVRARVTDTYGVKTLASVIENTASGKSLGSVTLTSVGGNWYEGSFTVPATYTDGTPVADADGRWTVGATDNAGNYTFAWSGFTVKPVTTTTGGTTTTTTTRTGGTAGTTGSTTGATGGTTGEGSSTTEETTSASVPSENPQELNSEPEVAGASTTNEDQARNFAWLWWVLGIAAIGGAAYWYWFRQMIPAENS